MKKKKTKRKAFKPDAKKQEALTLERAQLYTQEYFEERLALELRRAERYFVFLSLLLLSVKCLQFKKRRWQVSNIKPYLGKLGMLLKANIRDIDTVCLFEKDKFALILPETNAEGAKEVSVRLKKLIERHSPHGLQRKIRFAAAFGVSSFPIDAHSKAKMLENAREMMKKASAKRHT